MNNRYLAIALGLIVAILLIILGIFIVSGNKKTTQEEEAKTAATSTGKGITGTLDVNGVIPPNATIWITQKEVSSNEEPAIFAAGVAVADGDSWSFDKAETGKTYEIQAKVVIGTETVSTSSPTTITAPADQEELVLNIESNDTFENAVISGNIIVNGYIPENSTITVQGRTIGKETFTNIASNLPGQARQFMSYTTAISGTTYEIQGFLLNAQGVAIGTSETIALTAPAVNERLVINSTAIAPTPTPTSSQGAAPTTTSSTTTGTTISGSINLNGAVPSSSRIVVFAKKLNDQNYQAVVDNITPLDGASWTWSSAQNATWYTMIAILKQRQANGTDLDISDATAITIAAPATNVIFTINSGLTLSPPGGPVTVTCQKYNSGPNQNFWNVQVNFGSVAGALSYYLQIGTTNGGNETLNTAQNAQAGTAQTINAIFNNNSTYYARYAYANVSNQSTTSDQFSGFSSTTQLKCGT